MSRFAAVVAAAAVVLPAGSAAAGNVDLSTVPTRASVQLTIYNSEDLTLVRERRTVSFHRGDNALQFAWAGTAIDPTSVELEFPGAEDRLVLVDTVYPHDRPQVLVWNVRSETDGEAVVEISYFTSGISWSADYLGVTEPDEASMALEGFVRVDNRSGEDYDDASVRLVVGTINLVERIAELARLPVDQLGRLDERRRRELERSAAREMMMRTRPEQDVAEVPGAKEIVKKGLSEYFIFTIEGTETIPDGWSKRMRAFEPARVPVRVVHRYRPEQYGDVLTKVLLLRNDEASGLGASPLPGGTFRVLARDARGGSRHVAAPTIRYVPVGDEIELPVGADRDVVFELERERVWREEIWLQLHGADVLRKVGGGVTIDPRSRVVGWNTRERWRQRIANRTPRPIDVELRLAYDGDGAFDADFPVRLHDRRTVEFSWRVAPDEVRDAHWDVVRREGRNARQAAVRLD